MSEAKKVTNVMTAAQARRERGREEMRAQILEAALGIVTEEGVAALSMRGVARAIGYSPASLYEYFASKEELCKALFFEGTSGLSQRMDEEMAALPPDSSTSERLRLLGLAYREHALANADIYLLAFNSASAGFTPDRHDLQTGMRAFGILVDAIASGVERGELMQVDPGSIATAAWSIVHGFVMLELNHMISPDPALCGVGQTPHDIVDLMYADALMILSLGMLRRPD